MAGISPSALGRAQRQERLMVIGGAVLVVVIGLLVGFLTPVDSDLSEPTARISNIIGWTYFAAWSLSFYPQAILNFRRKSVVGLSFEYQLFNIIGFSCYSTFNILMYYSSYIRELYREKHDGNKVQPADVFFAIHGLLLTIVIVAQILMYDRGRQRLALWAIALAAVMVTVITIYAVIIAAGVSTSVFNWLDFVNFLSYIKLAITCVKYMPQALLNWRNRSTVGCNIHNFLLDFTGGLLSLVQLILDSYLTGDWSGITGDIAKFGLGLISIIYDVVFFVQHYALYPNRFDPALLRALGDTTFPGDSDSERVAIVSYVDDH